MLPFYEHSNNELLEDIAAFNTAFHNQRAYSIGTNILSATNGNYIHISFRNPSGSGKKLVLFRREFTTDAATAILALTFKPVFETLPGSTEVVPSNLYTGGPASLTRMRFLVDSTNIDSSTASSILPSGGIKSIQEIPRIIVPGEGFTYQIQGAGGSIQNAVKATAIFAWYEEDL